MKAVAVKQYEKALELVAEIDASHSREKRQIKIQALDGLGRQEELIELLNAPQSVDEVTSVPSRIRLGILVVRL